MLSQYIKMHRNSTMPSSLSDVLQLFSKFLSKMLERGILRTYTFLYSESVQYFDKNLENILDVLEELKAVLLKIYSRLSTHNKTLMGHQNTYHLISSNPMNNCVSRSENTGYSRNNDAFSLYASNGIQGAINENMQYITNNENRICDNLEHGFSSQGIASNALKSTEHDMFSECNSMNSLLKEDQRSSNLPTISYSNFKENLENTAQNDVDSLLSVHDSLKNCNTGRVNFSKNDSSTIDQTIERKIDSLNKMKYSDCSNNSYGSAKNEINADFLQSMKFSSTETQESPLSETNVVNFNEHVQYPQCENTLQNIDLDILNRSSNSSQQSDFMIRNSERINPNFDRIFDDQFPENESLLESECWNVDINLPSTEQISSNIDIQSPAFELTSCSPNMKTKSMTTSLEAPLVTDLEDRLTSNLSNSMSNVSTTFDGIHDSKRSDELEGDKYFCEHCGNIFDTKLKLKIHLKRKHDVYLNHINRCEQCGKIFKKRATLLTHARIHSEIKPFKCPYCWKTFTQKITRDSHIQLHTGMYKFSCKICQKRFPTQAKLNFHSKSHEEPELRCDVCSKMFTTKQYLNAHKKSHYKSVTAQGKSFSCIECSVLFSKKRDLLLHVKESHPEIKFMCYYVGCSRTYPTYKKMIDHIYKKHTVKQSCENDKKSRRFFCSVCRISFVEKSSFYRHNLLAHREKIDAKNSFNCAQCDKRFTNESSLEDHLEKFHNSSHSKEMNYSCSICGSLFYAESALKDHIKIHSDFNTHLCQTCGLVFSEKSNFLIHQSIHDVKKETVAKKFQCETCDIRFENKMELKQHELDVHDIVPNVEELKPYSCSYCDKRFTTRGKCNLHMETHSKERNYKCSKCDKTFYRRDLLKEHMNTHNGYRAHVCKLCGLAYSQKSSLKAHEATHEKTEETYSCEQCQKNFHSKQALNFHLKTHDGVYRFACEVCGKKFVRKCHYDLHVASHSIERPFKCLKCPASYKTSKHLREHSKKAHQNEPNFNSLFHSIYAEDEAVNQQNLLDEYIPSINPLDSELLFTKAQDASF